MKSLTQRLKRLKDDERGVSPVVGFVLIFALIMIVFTLYQSSVVPAQNEEVEFKHSQTVEGQMNELSSAIQSASADGASRSQTVAIGMNYPTRALAINPGSPAGTLQTSDPHPISITGVNVAGSKYWDGSPNPDLETESLSYAINYNVLQSGPEFTIANGALSKSYDSGTVAVSDSAAILPGTQKQIDLTLFGGNYQENGLTANPTAEPISTSTQYLHFTAGSNSRIGLDSSLTTDQCVAKWVGVGGTNNNHDDTVEFPNSNINCDTHDMMLDDGTDYTLRISKIGFGDTSGLSVDAHEVVPTEMDKVTGPGTATLDATVGEEKSFTVLVRDKYGNLVSGATVSTDNSRTNVASGTVEDSLTTDDSGTAEFTYTPGPDTSGTKKIVVSSPDASFKATYEFEVSDSTSDDSSDSGFSSGPPQIERVVQPSGPNYQGLMSFDIQPESPIEIEGFAIETRYDLSEIEETGSTHEFVTNNPSTTYPQSEPIQLDGRKYELDSPVTIDGRADSQIELHKFTSDQPNFAITDVVDSPREADLVVVFFLTDDSQRAVYFDGDTN